MPHDQWQLTSLWQQLLSRESTEASELRTALKIWMPDIERILVSGGTSPKDFTLHDADHSYRVAEWMAKLLPEGVLQKLSEFELVLLLLSAYLHDIGMTPEVDNVRRHRDFLLSGKDDLLSEDEAKFFQRWLDDAGYALIPPLPTDRPLDEVVSIADEIITYYTRHRHNDWSEAWIRLHLKVAALGSYTDWQPDLIRLCRSHHEGYEVLVGKEFNPRRVGSPAQVVHLRYLAVLLRVADILDVDPERTPEVIFHHRSIADSSQIYWHKDAHLSVDLIDGRLTATARPPQAYLHRAVEETIDGIERELALARKLDDDTRFEKIAGPGPDLPHKWSVLPTIYRDVEPQEHAYEYIDGAFRPNTRRLLDLLSGTSLYGEPLAAVRELLQNAFDAVRELIAYQRLSQPSPAQQGLGEALGNLISVKLNLESVDDRIWLVCRDDGIGMTKDIIANHFLVSGSPIRSQILALERRCAEAGFALGRTGQFGIGALSYFMLADHVVIITRRASEAGDFESRGWRFESSGIGTFGELREDLTRTRGTEVRLRLRRQILNNGTEDFRLRLIEYIRRIVVFAPCNLRVETGLVGTDLPMYAPGWTLDPTDLSRDALLQFEEPGNRRSDLLLPSEQERRDLSAHRWTEVRDDAKSKLEWYTRSGELPDNLGQFRFNVPYFKFSDGVCLAYVIVQEKENKLFLRGESEAGVVYRYESSTTTAWKGMQCAFVELHPRRFYAPWSRYGVIVEIDFRSPSAGELSVDRADLIFSARGKSAVDWVYTLIRDTLEEFVRDHADSTYALLNAKMCSIDFHPHKAQWIIYPVLNDESEPGYVYWTWTDKTSPQIPDLLDLRHRDNPTFHWQGTEVHIAPVMRVRDRVDRSTVLLPLSITQPDRVLVYVRMNVIVPVPIWTGSEPSRVQHVLGVQSTFPPEWQYICGIGGRMGIHDWVIWNSAHPIVKLAASVPAETELPTDLESLALLSDWLKRDAAAAAAWLIKLTADAPRLAKYLIETENEDFREIWLMAFRTTGTPIVEETQLVFLSRHDDFVLPHRALQSFSLSYDKLEINAAPPIPLPTDAEWLLKTY